MPEAGQPTARLQILDLPLHPRGDGADEIEVGEHGWTDDVPSASPTASWRSPRDTSPTSAVRSSPRRRGPGDPYGGRHDLSQTYLLRPLPAAPSHTTPIPRLYMLGAATWPGHGVNGGSGRIVAKTLLG